MTLDALSDCELVKRLGSDPEAVGELWRRHGDAGRAAARALAPGLDADDLVQEAFTLILESASRGSGPRREFRPYLYQVIRHLVYRQGSPANEQNADIDALADAEAESFEPGKDFDMTAVRSAFQSLSPRTQEVLWYSQVEGLAPRQFARRLRTTAANAAVLAFRAKEELRTAWIAAHLDSRTQTKECRSTVSNLTRYHRGTLTDSAAARVKTHLDGCAPCADASVESSRLVTVPRAALLSALIGIPLSTALGIGNVPGAAAVTHIAGAGGAAAAGSASAGGTGAAGAGGTVVAGASVSLTAAGVSVLVAASAAAVVAGALMLPAQPAPTESSGQATASSDVTTTQPDQPTPAARPARSADVQAPAPVATVESSPVGTVLQPGAPSTEPPATDPPAADQHDLVLAEPPATRIRVEVPDCPPPPEPTTDAREPADPEPNPTFVSGTNPDQDDGMTSGPDLPHGHHISTETDSVEMPVGASRE